MNRKSNKPFLTKVNKSQSGSPKDGNNNRKFGFNRSTAKAKKSVKLKPRAKLAIADEASFKPNSFARNGSSKTRPAKVRPVQAKKSRSPIWLAVYTVTIAVGLSTILGTIVSLANSWTTAASNDPTPANVSVIPQNDPKLDNLFAIASLGKKIAPLESNLQQLAAKYPDLEPQLFIVDLDTKGFVSIKGQKPIASASTIKLPILVAFFQDVDRGKIALDEKLTITQNLIAEGSGNMQYETPGTEFSALETADKMISISDNTATNMLIERLGGIEKLNQRFADMGLKATRLENPLPDLAGTNTTTPEDLGNLLAKIDGGDLVSLRSRDRILHIMRNLERNTLLPEGLGSGATIAHKTGDIKSMLGDVGIIDMPNGKRYIASMLIERPDNSLQAKEFIQQASRAAYQYFKNSQATSFSLEE